MRRAAWTAFVLSLTVATALAYRLATQTPYMPRRVYDARSAVAALDGLRSEKGPGLLVVGGEWCPVCTKAERALQESATRRRKIILADLDPAQSEEFYKKVQKAYHGFPAAAVPLSVIVDDGKLRFAAGYNGARKRLVTDWKTGDGVGIGTLF